MTDYKSPRPTATTSAANPNALYDNAVTFNKLLNEPENQTTYQGKSLISWQNALNLFGFGVASFDFATGGTLDSKNQLIRHSDELLYRYVGAGSFPLVVAPATNPVGNPDWEAFTATAHNLLSGRDLPGSHDASAINNSAGGSVQDFIDAQSTTISEVSTGKFAVGEHVRVTDRGDEPFEIVSGGTANGTYIIDAGTGKTAVLKGKPSIISFGGGESVSATINADVVEALLVYGTSTGTRIYSGDVGEIPINRGLSCELDGRLDWKGEKRFILSFPETAINAVDFFTKTGESHTAGVTLDGFNTKGGKYGTRIRAGEFGDNLLTFVDNVEVKNCYVTESHLSGIYLYHCQNVNLHHNVYYKCGDNGAYIAFCRSAKAHHNIAYNCRGSAGITMGYSDTIVSEGLEAAHNMIWNDDSAQTIPTASSPTSLGGVWMGHCKNGKVHSNVIWNDTNILAAKIKHGVWVDENEIENVVVENNQIAFVPENGVFVGNTSNSRVLDVYVRYNQIKRCRDGVRIVRGGDVHVERNHIKFSTQRGIIAEAGTKNVIIDDNDLIVCGQQDTFNTFFVVDNLSDRPTTTNNRIDDTPAFIVLDDPGGTVTVKVDPANSFIEFFVSGVSTYTVTVNRGSSIWGDIHTAITAIPELSGSILIGSPDAVVESIKRTGPPNQSFALEESANQYVLSYSPAYGYIRSLGRVYGNELVSRYMSAKITSTNLYNTQKPCAVSGTADRDTNDFGGARNFVGVAAPTVGFYRLGDTFRDTVDGGTFSAICTVSGYPGTWV